MGCVSSKKNQIVDNDNFLCYICSVNYPEYLHYPCGHYGLCKTCKNNLTNISQTNKCPICNKPNKMIKIYFQGELNLKKKKELISQINFNIDKENENLNQKNENLQIENKNLQIENDNRIGHLQRKIKDLEIDIQEMIKFHSEENNILKKNIINLEHKKKYINIENQKLVNLSEKYYEKYQRLHARYTQLTTKIMLSNRKKYKEVSSQKEISKDI